VLEVVRSLFSGWRLREIPLIASVYNFLFSRLKPEFIDFEGSKIYLDPLDVLLLYRNKGHESFITEIFKEKIKEGDAVLDLGAHIGYYTMLAAKLVGPQGKVFAFEPDPTNFSLLRKSAVANCYDNITLEQRGVADTEGVAKLFLYSSTENSIAPELYRGFEHIPFVEISLVGLDEYFKNANLKVSFIKMDVEGAEGLALQGMKQVISQNPHLTLITEFAPAALRKVSRMEPLEYAQALLDAGFKIYEIQAEARVLVPLFERNGLSLVLNHKMVEALVEKLTPETGCFGTNFLCLRD